MQIPNGLKKSLHETSRVERHEAIHRFVKLFSVVVLALEAIAEAAVKAAPKVHQLLACILIPTLIVSINTVAKALSLTLTLSSQLQTASSDLDIVLYLIDHVRLWRMRCVPLAFIEYLKPALPMGERVGVEIQMLHAVLERRTALMSMPRAHPPTLFLTIACVRKVACTILFPCFF